MAKFYAIKQGFDYNNNKKVSNVIVNTWDDCLKYVKGVKGAKYKSFTTEEEANKFLEAGSVIITEEEVASKGNVLHVYTDGSYCSNTGKASYGVVYVRNNIIENLESGKITVTENLNQTIGELGAALKAVHNAFAHNEKEVIIHYDYEGVATHATGMYNTNSDVAKSYNTKMQSLMKAGLKIYFTHISAHSGNIYNEIADFLCKNELKIPLDNSLIKALNSDRITVSSYAVVNKLLKLGLRESDIIIGNNIYTDKESEAISNIKEDQINENLSYGRDKNKETESKYLVKIGDSEYYLDSIEELNKIDSMVSKVLKLQNININIIDLIDLLGNIKKV